MTRTIFNIVAASCSLATISVATAGLIGYSTEQVINEGDSDAVIVEKAVP